MADIVVIGGCIVDLISYAQRFPRPGETLAGSMFCKGLGGKGANQCVMARRLGASCALIAKLGNDSFGEEYLKGIKESGIISEFVTFTSDAGTSTASICVTEEGLNSILYVPGAIMKLMPEDVKQAEPVIAKAKLLLCTYEAPLNTLLEALTIAKKYNVLTIVNAAPADPSYESLYPYVDIICLNEVEAEQSTSICVSDIKTADLAMQVLLQKKCSSIILTLGQQGAVYRLKNEPELVHVPARAVKAVDSTGAGDAFMGSLAYFLANCKNLKFKDMVQRSCEVATISVLKHGTQSSFPYHKDLPESMFKEN